MLWKSPHCFPSFVQPCPISQGSTILQNTGQEGGIILSKGWEIFQQEDCQIVDRRTTEYWTANGRILDSRMSNLGQEDGGVLRGRMGDH